MTIRYPLFVRVRHQTVTVYEYHEDTEVWVFGTSDALTAFGRDLQRVPLDGPSVRLLQGTESTCTMAVCARSTTSEGGQDDPVIILAERVIPEETGVLNMELVIEGPQAGFMLLASHFLNMAQQAEPGFEDHVHLCATSCPNHVCSRSVSLNLRRAVPVWDSALFGVYREMITTRSPHYLPEGIAELKDMFSRYEPL